MNDTRTVGSPFRLQQFIAGKWQLGSGPLLASLNPARPTVHVAEGPSATGEEVDAAVHSAQDAAPRWAATPIHTRARVLLTAAEILDRNADQWGLELATEEGKTIGEAVTEVRRAAQIFTYYGNAADQQSGEIFASPRPGERVLITHRPVGVVAAITPFNFPISIPAWKIAPALVFGNTVVWKPAETVPMLAVRLAQALEAADLPTGVLNLVIGGIEVGERLVNHDDIDAITFTGSTAVGRRVAASAAARGVALQAEMGGKNAAIVLDDANLDLAVEETALGAFRSAGQKCVATSRLILAERIAEPFLELLQARVNRIIVGDPCEPQTEVGPVVDDSAFASIIAGVRTAREQGAQLLTGNGAASRGLDDGYFVEPTVMELTSGRADIWTEELFGPVLAVRRVKDTDEAFTLANEGQYGLSAAVFTDNLTDSLRAFDELNVGILHVNSQTAGVDLHVPFGGVKGSGLGPKELGTASRAFFTTSTTVYLRGPE